MTLKERTTLLEQIQENIKQLSLEGHLELLKFLSIELNEKFDVSAAGILVKEFKQGRKMIILDREVFGWLDNPVDNALYDNFEDGEPFNPEDYLDEEYEERD